MSTTAIDTIHIAAGVNNKENPQFKTQGNALARFEFFESIVRGAKARYIDTKESLTFTEATEKFIAFKVKKNF